jgi:hypothetical protein
MATACLAAGVNFDVRRESGDPFELLPREARYHDLVIAGCPAPNQRSSMDEEDEDAIKPRMLIELTLGGARPMLIGAICAAHCGACSFRMRNNGRRT